MSDDRSRTILVYGRSRSGKTTLIGELTEHVYKTTGQLTRLATCDKGGYGSIKPYQDLGILEVVEQGDSDIWIWLNKVVRGYTRKDGKWVLDQEANKKVGLWAFEGITPVGDALMADMAKKAGQNVNIGGGSNISFDVSGDGERLKVSGSNMAHYGVAQTRITDEVWESQKLPGLYVLWTASASKDDDQSAGGKVLGPAGPGNKLTAEVPRWFNLTFRVDCLPAAMGKPERHILYLGNHTDVNAGNAVGLGNTRVPLDAPPITQTTIEPASLVAALALIDGGYTKAVDTIKKRIGK